jgi:hypothetical protein
MAAIVNACLLYELNAATVATQDNKIVLRILIYTIFAIKYDDDIKLKKIILLNKNIFILFLS